MTGKRWVGLGLRLVVTVVFVAWILSEVPWEKTLAEIGDASPLWLGAAFSLHLVGLWISALRWGWLLRSQGAAVRTRDLALSYLVAYFFNTFLPSGFGGDAVRAWDTRNATEGGERSAAVVVLDRASGILALFFLGAAVYLFGGWMPVLHWSVGLLLVGGFLGGTGALAMAILLGERLASGVGSEGADGPLSPGAKLLGRLARFTDGIRAFRDHPRVMAEVFGLGLALQLNVVLHHAFLGLALGIDIPFGFYFLMVPIVVAVMALPISINAIGPRDKVVILLFGLVGVPSEKALALSLLALAMTLVFSAVGGLVFLGRGRGQSSASS